MDSLESHSQLELSSFFYILKKQNPNTEREVILLDILDLLLDAASQSQQPWEAEGCLRVSLGPLTSACMSVNSRIAERSLSIATHSTAIMRSIVAGGLNPKLSSL